MTSEARFKSAFGVVMIPYLIWYVITVVVIAKLPSQYQLITAVCLVLLAMIVAFLAAVSAGTPGSRFSILAFLVGGIVGGWSSYAEKVQLQPWYDGLNYKVMLLITLTLMISLIGEYWVEICRWVKTRFA